MNKQQVAVHIKKKPHRKTSIKYICKENSVYLTKCLAVQEVLILKYINEFVDFPFVQKMIDYEISDTSSQIAFEKIDSNDIHRIDTDAKFICYIVIKFLMILHYEHQINHNDLNLRNIMYNHRSKYQFDTYDSFRLPEYVPVIIDFEVSQKFTEGHKILIDHNHKYFEQYNITSSLLPIHQDIYKFLEPMTKLMKQCGDNITNKDYPEQLYNKIFNSNVILKDSVYLILDLEKLDDYIKIKEINLSDL